MTTPEEHAALYAEEGLSARPPLPDGMPAEPGQEPGGTYFDPYFGREFTVDYVYTDVRPGLDGESGSGEQRWIPGKTWLEVSWPDAEPQAG